MKIREVTRYSERVYEAVLRLLPQLSPDLELPSRQYLEAVLKAKNTHFFIAELDNRSIAGMLTLASYNLPASTKFWIEDVVVDESHRGKGIGKELMLHAISFARSSGAKSIDLTSRPFRTGANKLYRDMGFILRETNAYRYYIK